MKDLSKLTEAERQEVIDGIIFNNRHLETALTKYLFSQLQHVRSLIVPDFGEILIIPDIHVWGLNEAAAQCLDRLIADIKPAIIIILGDVADSPNISRWAQGSNIKSYDLDEELTLAGKLITRIHLKSGAVLTVLIGGNHDRFQPYLDSQAGPLATLSNRDGSRVFSMKERMKISRKLRMTYMIGTLNRGGWDGGVLINNKHIATHGSRSTRQPGGAARVTSDNLNKSVHTGHTHKAGNGARETTGNGVITWAEYGFLASYVAAIMGYLSNLDKNWQAALGLLTIAHGGVVNQQLIPIQPVTLEDGREVFGLEFAGKEYLSTDY